MFNHIAYQLCSCSCSCVGNKSHYTRPRYECATQTICKYTTFTNKAKSQKHTYMSLTQVIRYTIHWHCSAHALHVFICTRLKCLGCFAPVTLLPTPSTTYTYTHPNSCTRNLTIWFGFCFYLFIYFHARTFIVAPSFMFAIHKYNTIQHVRRAVRIAKQPQFRPQPPQAHKIDERYTPASKKVTRTMQPRSHATT